MNMSKEGIKFLIGLEGFKNKAYKDTKGLWTIGVGHLIQPGEHYLLGIVLKDQDVESLFAKDIQKYEEAVNHTIHNDITQYQFDALVSLCFNIGCNGFSDSTIARIINNGEFNKAADAMMMWNKPKEIIGRRSKEVRLFCTGSYK